MFCISHATREGYALKHVEGPAAIPNQAQVLT